MVGTWIASTNQPGHGHKEYGNNPMEEDIGQVEPKRVHAVQIVAPAERERGYWAVGMMLGAGVALRLSPEIVSQQPRHGGAFGVDISIIGDG